MRTYYVVLGGLLFLLFSCQSQPPSTFREALTFYVSFDNGTTADFALGEKNIYTATSRKNIPAATVGMHNANHKILKGQGQLGDAFDFGAKGDTVLFYKSKDNIAYDPERWTGSISFWLSVDPATDLDGYTDPVQITDVSYNDASIWVDFTDKAPRDFRLGVLGDKEVWIQDTLNMPMKEVFEKRTVVTKASAFSRDTWTHVLISYDGLGTSNSLATLYMNGTQIGSVSGIDDPFSWDLDKSNIFLGLNFTGSIDELSIYNKPLTAEQVLELYHLKGGVKSIL